MTRNCLCGIVLAAYAICATAQPYASKPVRTPAAIVKRLHAEFAQIMQNAEIKQRLDALGYEVTLGPSEQFGKRIRDEVAKWPKVVQAMGGPVN